MFQCGCTSGLQSPAECGEESHRDEAGEPHRHPQQHPGDVCYDDEHDSIRHKIISEKAKDYFDRISKQLAVIEAIRKKDNLTTPKQSNRTSAGSEKSTGIATVFRMSTSSTMNTTRQFPFPLLKCTDSESTQSTEALSDDELSFSSEEEEEAALIKPVIISILRRKKKLGAVEIAPTGSAVKFCPKTVFPDPSEVPQKRKRIPRLLKPQDLSPVMLTYESYESHCELRRLERRAQQRQHPYITNDFRSPSSDALYPSDSFYTFR